MNRVEVSVKDLMTAIEMRPPPGIITIAGAPGSGKSSVAARLLVLLPGFDHFSAGQAFRRLAAELGMTVNELTALADCDHCYDRMVDDSLMAFGRQTEMAVIDSRMAWHFLPDSFKVYLAVNSQAAARRILLSGDRGAMERYATLMEAEEAVRKRGLSERNRYFELYGVDILDPGNYDLIIDTSDISADRVAERVLAACQVKP